MSPPRLTDIHFTLIFEFFKCLALCVFWPTLKLYYSPCHALVIGFIGWLIKLRLCYLAYAFFCKACCIYYKCLEAIDTYSLNIFHRKTTQSASTNWYFSTPFHDKISDSESYVFVKSLMLKICHRFRSTRQLNTVEGFDNGHFVGQNNRVLSPLSNEIYFHEKWLIPSITESPRHRNTYEDDFI